jgi:hypothetical protein
MSVTGDVFGMQEVRVLRRLSQLQNMAMADLVNDTYLKVCTHLLVASNCRFSPLNSEYL